ncbi:MAG: hypothetical protein KIS92_24475, partial [Planctomycetota bacterium]|nr:hypothetical protein [Planctomycetota bacterium]
MAAAEPLHLSGPRVLPLEGSQAAWRVRAGSVALFASQTRGGQPEGPRRPLGEIGAHGMLFGLPAATAGGRGVFAIASAQAELEPLGWEGFLAWFSEDGASAAQALEAWLKALASYELAAAPQAASSAADPGVSLEPGQAWTPGPRVRWMRVTEGYVRWMGRPDTPLGGDAGWLPMPPGRWVEAGTRSALAVRETEAFAEREPLLLGLRTFHALTLLGLDEADALEGRAGEERIQARRAFTRRFLGNALHALASVTSGRSEP